MSRGEALSALSSAARAFIGSIIDNIFGFDRGQRREINDCTLDARAIHFSHWLERINLYLSTLLVQGLEIVNLTLATYSQWVGKGNSLRDAKIISIILAAYLATVIALLERHNMDDPRCSSEEAPDPRCTSHPSAHSDDVY
jgi:hypothetical protein